MQVFWLKTLLPLLTAATLLHPHTPLWLALLVLPLLFLFYPARQRWLVLIALVTALLLGAIRWVQLLPPASLQQSGELLLKGKVHAVSSYEWGTRLTLSELTLLSGSGNRPLHGRYQLISKSRQIPEVGDLIRFRGRFQLQTEPLNRGEQDWRWAGRLQGVVGEFRDVSELTVSPGSPHWHRRARDRLLFLLGKQLNGSQHEIAGAMLLGARERLSPDLKEQFVQAGIVHLLAVSGLHVGFIAAILLVAIRLLPLPRKLGWVMLPLLLVVYALICGGRPSVVRAVLMASLYCWGQLLERSVAPLPALLASATLNGLYNPLVFFEVGFQLSYLALLAVLVALRVKLPESRIVRSLLRPLLISGSCFLLLLPLILFYFGRVSPIGILVNLPAIPLAAVITGQGVMMLACSSLAGAADLVGFALRGSISMLEWVLQQAVSAPGSDWQLHSPPLSQLLLIMLLLLILMLPGNRRRLQQAMLVLLAAGSLQWFLQSPPRFELTAINVGQGDALLLRAPSGHTTLIDAGLKRGRLDRGKLQVVPYLRRQGVKQLDLLLVTHTDMDHMGGVPAVLREIECTTLCLADRRESRHFNEIISCCDSSDTVVREVRGGEILVSQPGYRLYLLSPPAGWRGDRNERSLLLKAVCGNRSVLLTGDAGERCERMLIRVWDSFLESDLLKLGHHGSNSSSSDSFLEQVDPARGLISCGRDNRYGHPAPLLLQRLQDHEIEIHRTDLDGKLQFSTDGKSWRVEPRWWLLSARESYFRLTERQ